VGAAIAALGQDSLAWAVTEAGTGEPVGNAAVAVLPDRVEPSYWVVPSARGRGVATAVLIELVHRCRAAGHERVEVVVMAGNTPSHRVAVKAGFVEVGREEHAVLGPCVRYRHRAARPPE
jgi:RimJ/RimL family protein N-acetyltransferase